MKQIRSTVFVGSEECSQSSARSTPFKAQWLLYVPAELCPRGAQYVCVSCQCRTLNASFKNLNCLVSVMEKQCVFCEEPTLCVLFRLNAFLKGLKDEWAQIRISVNHTFSLVVLSIAGPGLGQYFSCATTDSFRILSVSSLTNSRACLRCSV